MGWAQNFASKTPLKRLNWSSTNGFSYKNLYIRPARNPEKSRDFISKNPGIFINLKSRDPGIPGIPLRPAHSEVRQDFLLRRRVTLTKTPVTRKRKVEKSIQRCQIDGLREGCVKILTFCNSAWTCTV